MQIFSSWSNIFQFVVIVETEIYRSELTKVRAELEPWEKQLIEHKGKLDVASNESKLLKDKVSICISQNQYSVSEFSILHIQ